LREVAELGARLRARARSARDERRLPLRVVREAERLGVAARSQEALRPALGEARRQLRALLDGEADPRERDARLVEERRDLVLLLARRLRGEILPGEGTRDADERPEEHSEHGELPPAEAAPGLPHRLLDRRLGRRRDLAVLPESLEVLREGGRARVAARAILGERAAADGV